MIDFKNIEQDQKIKFLVEFSKNDSIELKETDIFECATLIADVRDNKCSISFFSIWGRSRVLISKERVNSLFRNTLKNDVSFFHFVKNQL